MPTLLLFGAGNIGRSFIAQIFARNGWEVVFADINDRVVDEINRRRSYEVIIKHPDGRDEAISVEGVRAVSARDRAAVRELLAHADLAATAVGAAALPAVATLIGEGLRARAARRPGAPLDVILAENVRDAAAIVREAVAGAVSDATSGDEANPAATLGLVQTSIGKMVPLVPAEVSDRDPLVVFAEPYNTLIVDAKGFLGGVPELPQLKAVENIRAYVDRKLFVHNLGHAAVAYLGFRTAPEVRTIAGAVAIEEVRAGAAAAMEEACAALASEYPADFTSASLADDVADLLTRFANPALGDTIFRVGRDLPRKLARDDRIVGAMLLAARHRLACRAIARVYRAAVDFRATDDSGARFPADEGVTALAEHDGLDAVVTDISGLEPDRRPDTAVVAAIREAGGDSNVVDRSTSGR